MPYGPSADVCNPTAHTDTHGHITFYIECLFHVVVCSLTGAHTWATGRLLEVGHKLLWGTKLQQIVRVFMITGRWTHGGHFVLYFIVVRGGLGGKG